MAPATCIALLDGNLAPPPSNHLESVGVAEGILVVTDSVTVRVSWCSVIEDLTEVEMGIDLATWRGRIGLNNCRQSRCACRQLLVQWRAARWGVGEVMNSTPLLLQGCMAVVSLSLILGYTFRRRPIRRCGCGKVCRPKLRDGSVPSAEVRGMADTGIIGVFVLLGVCAVVLALLLLAGDVERNPGPTGKEGSDQVDKVLPTVDNTPLGEDDHFDILTEMMPVASSWKAIGRGLQIESGRLETIQESNPGKPKECLSDMLTCWLNRNYNVERFGEPTWRAVVKVVAHPAAGDNCALALNIAKNHPVASATASQTTKKTPLRSQQDLCTSKRVSSDVSTSEGASVGPTPSSSSWREETQMPGPNASAQREKTQSPGCSSSTQREEAKRLGPSASTQREETQRPGPSASTQREETQRPGPSYSTKNVGSFEAGSLEAGSPPPTHNSFPYLKVNGLTPEQQERLKTRLCVESEDIVHKFWRLHSRVYESLCERNVPVDKLVTHLLSLCAFDPVYKGSQKPALQTFFQELQNAGSIEEVLFIIRDYISFFNYRVIEHIVDGLGTDQDKVELQNYKKEFNEYAQRRIYECPPVYGPMSIAEHADLVVKVDSVYENFTVKQLKNFEHRLSQIFCVSPQSGLRLCQVEEGCLQLIFQVPSFVQQEIFPLSSEQERALAAEGVIRLTCGDYQFVAKGDEDGSEPEDTESVPKLTGPVFQAALTTHNIDADSAMGISIITDDRSSWFSDDEEDPLSKELDELDEEFESNLQITVDTPELHLAARRGDLEKVKFLTDSEHQNPLQKDKYGNTALHAAAQGGSLDILKYFIEEGNCNPANNFYGRTLLHVATEHTHLDVVKYLVTEQQVEPLCQDERGWTPLHVSCESGGLSIVKFLTEEIEKYKPMKDLMPSLTTKSKNTPLHFAALNGHIDIVRFFITDLKCSPNIPGFYARTPLHDAAARSRLHIVKYLIDEEGCDPSCLDEDNQTPLQLAASRGHLDIVKYLILEKNCNPTPRISSGITPIHWSAIYGHLEILNFFIADLKCSPNIPGKHGRTPVHDAAERGHLHIVKYLIDEQGCDPSCLDRNEQTPLHLATSKGHLDIVKFLTLEKHCNPNQRDIRKNTPLHYAAGKGHLQVVQFFVEELKCHPHIRGQRNATPRQLAEAKAHHNVALYLQKFQHSTN